MVAVKLDDLSMAFEFVGAGAPCENYEADSIAQALRAWCAENGLELSDSPRSSD